MKRILTFLALFVFIPCLVLPVYAHPGRTDSKGGHTNHSTGEYHYHHGQSAHQHYDMDGDGDLDCPYNFKTISNSSKSTSSEYRNHNGYPAHKHTDIDGDGDMDCPYDYSTISYPSSNSKSSSLESATKSSVTNANKSGATTISKTSPNDASSTKTSSNSSKSNSEAPKTQTQQSADTIQAAQATAVFSTLMVVCAIVFPIACYSYSKSRTEIDQSEIAHREKTNLLKKEHASELRRQKESYESQLKTLKDSHSRLNIMLFKTLSKTESISKEYEDQISELIATHNEEIRQYANEVDFWKSKFQQMSHNGILYDIRNGSDPDIRLPENISLRESFTPIKGKVRTNYPYGDYTVFQTRNSKKYHCSYQCARTGVPMHFFDVIYDGEPCRNCVPKDMYPQPLPEWYMQIRRKLDDTQK